MPESRTAPDTDNDWPQPQSSDVYVSAAGKYCCTACETVLQPTTRPAPDGAWQRHLWHCPACDTDHSIQ